MDSEVLTTTVMTTATQAVPNATMPEDMLFNDGHMLSIIVYRSVFARLKRNQRNHFDAPFYFCLRSILMVISAVGNISVLVILIKRRMRTPSRLDVMLTHLAIADLMVSSLFTYANVASASKISPAHKHSASLLKHEDSSRLNPRICLYFLL